MANNNTENKKILMWSDTLTFQITNTGLKIGWAGKRMAKPWKLDYI